MGRGIIMGEGVRWAGGGGEVSELRCYKGFDTGNLFMHALLSPLSGSASIGARISTQAPPNGN